MKRIIAMLLAMMLILTGCQSGGTTNNENNVDIPDENAVEITLSDDGITVDGEAVSTDSASAVYTANDIVYYPTGQDFTFGEGTEDDAHEASEADGHTVVHIAEPGTYSLSGTLSAGQIAIDLGEDAEEDPNAVVNLIMNGADITCTVAPAVIFYNVYECGTTDEASETVDTVAAGANVYIADGTVNNVTGSYVARIYEADTVVLTEDGTEVEDAEKLHKYDAAFYSKMSMNINGNDGVLNIDAENEGLDSELHLTINGGEINITSGNDGINTNEDGISVTTINGGNVNINVTGETGEGDGIDSNGWLVINGGSVTAAACYISGDAGIDSDMGIYINGGTVKATGNMLDQIAGGDQTYAVFTFASSQAGESTYTIKNADGADVMSVTPANDFTYLIIAGDELTAGDYTFYCGDTQLAASAGQGFGGMGGMMPGGQIPEDMEIPEGMEMPEGMERSEMPEGTEMTPPEGMENMERPEMPEGMTPPEGMDMPENMELPEGMEFPENGEIPQGGQGFGGRGQMGQMGAMGETSEVFTIAEGANYFSFVSAFEA